MKLSELIHAYRADAADHADPPLVSDDELIRFFNEAADEASLGDTAATAAPVQTLSTYVAEADRRRLSHAKFNSITNRASFDHLRTTHANNQVHAATAAIKTAASF
ncbi:MAG: hypothetical protein EOO27_40535, partial [Comamonadaceae bacterium]